ncbi:MAG TPA: hypothetical protein ENN43_08640, partial [bacterium]|nr:hypothetical protein [bacterium]
FIELGKKLVSRGERVAVCCIAKERPSAERIAAAIGLGAAVCEGNFMTFAHYISRMKLFVGNDSALIHVAAAVGTKSVALFGPENPEEWHPYEEKDGHTAISKLKEIEAGGRDIMDRKFREKSLEPIMRITPGEVYDAAVKLLERQGRAG